jgi:hypothetical protein
VCFARNLYGYFIDQITSPKIFHSCFKIVHLNNLLLVSVETTILIQIFTQKVFGDEFNTTAIRIKLH